VSLAATGGIGLLAGCGGFLGDSSDGTDGPLVADGFEGDSLDADRWVLDDGDDETVEVRDGTLYTDSPKETNDAGQLRTAAAFEVRGTVRVEARVKLHDLDSWDGRVGELFFTETNGKASLVELDNASQTGLVVSRSGPEIDGSNVSVAPHVETTDWHDYAFTIDLDDGTVTEVERDGETFEESIDVSPAIGDSNAFRIGVRLGRGVERSHEYLRARRIQSRLAGT
jgi:hypothetical protein